MSTDTQDVTLLDVADTPRHQTPAIQQRGGMVAAQSETATLAHAIISAATDPSVNVEKMERLLAMHERITAKDAEQKFNASMVEAQSRMGRITADAVNPQTRSKYATYAQLDRHVRPIYTAQGFSLSFNAGTDAPEGHVRVLCYASHAAGHTRTYQCDMPADGKGAKGNDVMTKTHASGSAMSYGMRYLLKLIFNIAVGEDDDDGNTAGGDVSEFVQGWIDFALSLRGKPDEFAKAIRDARKAIGDSRDMAGLRAFNAEVSA